MLKVLDKLTSDGVIPVVDAVSKVGADYSSPMHPFDDYSITAGRVISGANPASARSAAERAVKAFDALPTTPAREGQSVADHLKVTPPPEPIDCGAAGSGLRLPPPRAAVRD